jgi:hypothetical protein
MTRNYTHQVLLFGKEDGQRQILHEIRRVDTDAVREFTLTLSPNGLFSLNFNWFPFETSWDVQTPGGALQSISVTSKVLDDEEEVGFFWFSPGEEALSRTFRVPSATWEELETEGPIGHRFTEFRTWRTALRDNEIRQHQIDPLSWGSEYPSDEAYDALAVPVAKPEFKLDLFDNPLNNFSESAYTFRPNSREKPLLASSWSSFSLRGGADQWMNAVTEETEPLVDEVLEQSFFLNVLDPRWDESTIRSVGENRIRAIDDTEISPAGQSAADWRFGIEFSPTGTLDIDQLRGHTDLGLSMDEWVGAPENLFSQRYVTLEDFRNSYFGRVFSINPIEATERGRVAGALPYLQSMRLHRWLHAQLRELIDELIPFNVAYLGFNNIIEPHVTERAKVVYPGSERYLEPLQRIEPSGLRLTILSALVRRF